MEMRARPRLPRHKYNYRGLWPSRRERLSIRTHRVVAVRRCCTRNVQVDLTLYFWARPFREHIRILEIPVTLLVRQ
jgi:hypothetical protein